MMPDIGCEDIDDSRRMVFIDAEKPQLFGGGIQIRFGILCGVFRLFESALGDRAFVVRDLLPLQLLASQALIVHGLPICLVSSGYVVALDSQQELAFLHHIAEPGLDFHDPA